MSYAGERAFHGCIARCNDLLHLHNWFSENAGAALSTDDLLRSCYVLSVAAYDALMVELCVARFQKIRVSQIQRPRKFNKIRIPAAVAVDHITAPHMLDDSYRNEIQFRAYQNPEKIKLYVSEVSDGNFWRDVARKMTESQSDIKSTLANIASRRNRIVHEGDSDPTFGGATPFLITYPETLTAVRFISRLGDASGQVLS